MRIFAAVLIAALAVACAGEEVSTPATDSAQRPAAAANDSGTTANASGTSNMNFVAIPDPVPVCDSSKRGITTIAWGGDSGTTYEVHVGGPDGTLFAAGRGSGSARTGKWVTDGMKFTLVSKTSGQVVSSINVSTTTQGCP